MKRELAVSTYIYMDMLDGETQDDAVDRLYQALESAGLSCLDFDNDNVSIYEY